MLLNISPLTGNRKRSRTRDELSCSLLGLQNIEMELDKEDTTNIRAISELNSQELKIAQIIAREGIKASLYITIPLPSTEPERDVLDSAMDYTVPAIIHTPNSVLRVESKPFVFGNEFVTPTKAKFHFSVRTSPTKRPTYSLGRNRANSILTISTICHLILKQGNATPSKLSYSLEMTQRATDILDSLQIGQDTTMIGQEDTMDLFRILINLLQHFRNLIPIELYAVCQGILAINQATGLARKAGGTSVKGIGRGNIEPTNMVKGLVRNVLILLPTESRELMHIIVGFTGEFCQKVTARTRNLWARQLAIVIGHVFEEHSLMDVPSKRLEPSWKSVFIEVLVHSHGLHSSESDPVNDIWKLDAEFVNEVSLRYRHSKTPKKKVSQTPNHRKSVARCGGNRTLTSGCKTKKRLFNPSGPFVSVVLGRSEQSPTSYIALAAEQNSPTPVDHFDRETYNKRLRIK